MLIPFKKIHTDDRLFKQIKPIAAIGVVAIIVSYFFLDIPLALFFQKIPLWIQSITQIITDLIDPRVQYLVWPILFFMFFFIWNKKLLANRFLCITISMAIANAIIEVLKRLVGRARPELLWSDHVVGFHLFENQNTFFSFPSGHASVAGVMMGLLASFYPKYSYLCLGMAFVLSLTRVVLGYHYLSDIIAGTLIGIFTAQATYRVMKAKF